MALTRVLLVLLLAAAVSAHKKTVLSFGGNGNIGSEVLSRMIADKQYDITLVSRGRWHFDSAVRIAPFVHTVVCDRSKDAPCMAEENCDINTLRHCPDVMRVINGTKKFDIVLDFSGYVAKWVHDAIDLFKKANVTVGVYVYISTDSVYEVSEQKATKRASLETDARRPRDVKVREEAARADEYGNAKLACEEALRWQQEEEDGFPWVALRLSDVIGPRDTTYRFSMYHLWLLVYHDLQLPLSVPAHVVNVTESMTYVMDAAKAIMTVVEKGSGVWNEAYNIAMKEEFTLWNTLNIMAKIMGVENIEQDNTAGDRSFALYPTVFNGPTDISKAIEKLEFVPTPAEEAFRTTIAYYDQILISMGGEREEVMKRLLTYVVPRHLKDTFYMAVGRILEKAGVVDEKFRKRRKGDLEADEKQEL